VVFAIQNSSAETEKKLKPLKEIIFTKPIVSKQQLVFLQTISEFYHVSLGFLLKINIIPLQPRKLKQLQTSNSAYLETSTKTAPSQSKPELSIYKKLPRKNKTSA
jgi:primosomal protein N'